jgi:DNA polymerase III delta subunit
MITLLYGTDAVARNKKREKIESDMRKAGTDIVTLTYTTFSQESIESFLQTQGLFGGQTCVVLKDVLSRDDAGEYILKAGTALSESKTHFIFDSEVVSKEQQKLFSKLGTVEQYDADKKKPREKFNTFSLTDAFNKKDKKNLWVLYSEALRAGVSPEEIVGVLFWNIKNIVLYCSAEQKSATTTGISPFVFSKLQTTAKNFSKDEALARAKELTEITHASRMGQGDSATLLELFILKAFS